MTSADHGGGKRRSFIADKRQERACDFARCYGNETGNFDWDQSMMNRFQRTNLTLINPTILQTDATTPYASFGVGGTRSVPSRPVSMHFEPIAYGITYAASYIMEFIIQTNGSTTFDLDGYVGSGSLPNRGTKVINGSMTVQLVMQNVQPSQQTYGFLSQTSGASWNWYFTNIRFPPLVIER